MACWQDERTLCAVRGMLGSLVKAALCALVLLCGSHRLGLTSSCSSPMLTGICCSLSAEDRRERLYGGVFLFANAESFICEQ